MLTDELLAGYGRYRRNIAGNQRKLERLAREGQSPTTLWVGCSDSRVIPEQITDADPGDLFVMRNIANFVPPYGRDDAVGAVIEFAVLQLGVKPVEIQLVQLAQVGNDAAGGTPRRRPMHSVPIPIRVAHGPVEVRGETNVLHQYCDLRRRHEIGLKVGRVVWRADAQLPRRSPRAQTSLRTPVAAMTGRSARLATAARSTSAATTRR